MSLLEKPIDKTIPVPLYYQLKSIILDSIESGKLQPGDSIPTEQELSEIYEISRTTIRQAINELVTDGKLYRIKSKGTFVSKPKLEQLDLQNLDFRPRFLNNPNVKPSRKVLQQRVVEADKEISQRLEVPEGSDVIYLEVLRLINNEPVIYQQSYLASFCREILSIDVEEKGVNDFLYHSSKTRPVYGTRWIESILADRALSEKLEAANPSAILYYRSLEKNSEDIPVVYTRAYYRGDRMAMKVAVKQ